MFAILLPHFPSRPPGSHRGRCRNPGRHFFHAQGSSSGILVILCACLLSFSSPTLSVFAAPPQKYCSLVENFEKATVSSNTSGNTSRDTATSVNTSADEPTKSSIGESDPTRCFRECVEMQFPETRSGLPQFLNCMGLLGTGAEVGVQGGVHAKQFLEKWLGDLLLLVDKWENVPSET
jgi:hypothetical protein